MPEAISDTGPILHLHEIGCLEALGCFDALTIPDLVAAELEGFGFSIDHVRASVESPVEVQSVEASSWRRVVTDQGDRLQPADAQVLTLAVAAGFGIPVLTDDLEIRRAVEKEGGLAVGSIGILVKNYHQQRFAKSELERRVDQLVGKSTLHMSRPFRRYVRTLIQEIE